MSQRKEVFQMPGKQFKSPTSSANKNLWHPQDGLLDGHSNVSFQLIFNH